MKTWRRVLADQQEQEPVICHDGHEMWIVYPSENAYLLVVKVKPDEEGIRHVAPELVEGLKGWWYRQAVDKVQAALDELNIPWEELHVTGPEIEAGDLMTLSKKLAMTSHYIVRVNNLLGLSTARHAAAKEALEQATNQMMAQQDKFQDKGEGRKPAIAVRAAALIHQRKPLRNAKIDIIESGAFAAALTHTKDSLDTLWRTASRIISARLKEPLE